MAGSPLPVLIGVGQVTDRPDDPRTGLEPLALMETAARRAAEDAGLGSFDAVDTVAVVTNVFHDYGDPARLLAERLPCPAPRRLTTTWGGNTPQSLVSHLCDEIAAGRAELALVAGGEAFQTMRALGKAAVPSPWTEPVDGGPRWGDLRQGTSDLESRHGLREATVTYALVENAFRAARGQSLAAQQAELGAFGERCARVAAANPYAWFRDAKDAATLTTVTPSNRMVAFPYPKYLNAIMDVNQGAALLLASEHAARRLGVPQARWVYPWAGVDVTELWYLSERVDYATLPGLGRAGAALSDALALPLDVVSHLDLYGCFPIAPRLVASALGLDPATTRPLTLTGALPWFGGPGNNYVTHAIAAAVERLRAAPGTTALVHGLGWNFTKHALAVYGTTPPEHGWRRAGGDALQAAVDAQPHPALAPDASGPAAIETYTVVHGRDGDPERGVVIARLEDGRRCVAVLPRERAVLEDVERAEAVGRRGRVQTDAGTTTFLPA